MKKLVLVFGVVLALGTMAMASDIAFYVGAPNPDGWYDVATQTKDVATIIARTGQLFGDVQKFDDAHFKEFAAWVDARTNDGKMDIIWLNGCMPSCLYQFPNVNPNGSRAELWLDGGNMIINVGDWFAYCSYEGGSRQADNGGAGAANILDLSSGIIASADNTAMTVTPTGKQYLPSIGASCISYRPVVRSAVVAPWEVAAVFASTNGTDNAAQADPIVIHNTATGGYVAFINQAAGGGPPGWLADRGLTCAEFIKNWVNTVIGLASPAAAGGPNPADGTVDVPRDAVLSWTAGMYPSVHDVYLGTAFADVNTASRTNAKGVLAGKGQADTTFDPPGSLAYGQTYYWRIDEVNKTPDGTIAKGSAWSFTAEPYGYPVKPVKATASSYQTGMGPEKTMDGSGLDKSDLHGTEPTTMWMSAGAQPNWIQYEFDKVYKLHQLQVWNSNQLIESFLGFGAKKVTVETSTDGTTWKALANVPEFARASGAPGYAANTTVNFGGVEAKFVKLTIGANWGGMAPQTGLAEVRFLYVPVQARVPQPATGAAGVSLDASLNWRPGREAGSHKVFFGTDQAAVAGGTAPAKTMTDHSFSPGSLNLGTTYYWKVDEVNTVTYPGDVWSFTTQDYKAVDDFESYTDKAGAEVFTAWVDGFADNYKSSGSTVGKDIAQGGTFCETTIFHGGRQSMPLRYDNTKTPNFSEAVRTFDTPQNWTGNGIKSLSLWFQGVAGNSGQLYVKINSTKVPYDGAAGNLAKSLWIPWNIDLSKVAGNLSKVTSLTIGIEGAGAKGTLYVDDIGLYPKTPEYYTPADPGKTNLKALYTFEGNVNDMSGNGLNGTLKLGTLVASGRPDGGSALKVDKAGYVDLGNPPSLDFGTGDWTVTAWFKTAMKGTGDTNQGTIYAKGGDSTAGKRIALIMTQNTEGVLTLVVDDDITRYDANSKTLTNDDQWHFVAGQREGRTIRIFIDGQLEGTTTLPAGYNLAGTSQRNAYIGASTYQPDGHLYKFFGGLIDDVRLYNRALSVGEILWLAGQSTPAAKPF